MAEFYEEVGRLIRARREERAMSQAQLASAVQLTRTSISNIENGRQHLPLHTLYRVAGALSCHPHTLLPEPGAITATGELESALASGTQRADLKAFLSRIHKSRPDGE